MNILAKCPGMGAMLKANYLPLGLSRRCMCCTLTYFLWRMFQSLYHLNKYYEIKEENSHVSKKGIKNRVQKGMNSRLLCSPQDSGLSIGF